MKQELKDQCYILSIKGYMGKEIAEKLNIKPQQVSRALKSITESHDYKLAVQTISIFIEEMQRASDFFKAKIKELEEMTPQAGIRDKIEIIKLQTDLYSKVVEVAQQGKVLLALRKLRDGQAKLYNKESLA